MYCFNYLLKFTLVLYSVYSVSSFVNTFNKKYINIRPLLEKTPVDILDAEYWDDGEVSWDFLVKKENTNVELDYNETQITKPTEVNVIEKTPLIIKIEIDQKQVATVSALVKTTYKEVFSIDNFISEVHKLQHGQVYGLTPVDVFTVSFLYTLFYGYNKVKQIEEKRLKKLYEKKYLQTYYQMKKSIMVFFIIITFVFTKNIETAS